MSDEMEAAGLASLGGLSVGGKADLAGQPCRNCGEVVEQRHCPQCGQLAASYHKPFYSLVAETVSDSLAIDGRIARTLPLLLFRPGVLSRRYSREGKRMRYVPPFRLFLLSSLLFYFVVFAFLNQVNWLDFANENVRLEGQELSEEDLTELREAFVGPTGEVNEERLDEFLRGLRDGAAADEALSDSGEDGAPSPGGTEDVTSDTPGTADTGAGETAESPGSSAADDDMSERVERIIQQPRVFVSAVETWLPRLSLLMVPLTMLALSIMYFWRRRIYIYDHAIHALNLHSWMYLTATVAMLGGLVIGSDLATLAFFIAIPVYVTFSLRGAYQSGFFTSFLRMMLLCIFWVIALSVLSIGVVVASALSV